MAGPDESGPDRAAGAQPSDGGGSRFGTPSGGGQARPEASNRHANRSMSELAAAARDPKKALTDRLTGGDTTQKADGGKPSGGAVAKEALAKSAEAAATAAFTPVAGKVAGMAVRHYRKTLALIAVAVVMAAMPYLLIFAMVGGVVSGIPYALEDTDAAAGEIPDDVLEIYYAVARQHPEVPWTVLAGIGHVQTTHGRFSPYDGIDRDPERSPTSTGAVGGVGMGDVGGVGAISGGSESYDGELRIVPAPEPAIGNAAENEALGPLLLRPEAAVSLDDPQDFEDSVTFVAEELTRIREELDADGWEYDERRPETVDRYWAEAVQRLAPVMADPSGEVGDCAVPDTAPSEANLAAWVDAIWRCEISAARLDGRTLQVVDRVTFDANGVATYNVLPEAAGAATLLAEARTVAYAFSGLDPKGAHATSSDGAPQPKCDDSKAVAGVFPLWVGVEGRAGYSETVDRCDAEENIRVAARAVLTWETTTPATRRASNGPYEPMSGGWVHLPWALGGTDGAARFAAHGPYDAWVPSDSCAALLDASLAELSDDPALIAMVTKHPTADAAQALLDRSGIPKLRTNPACSGTDRPLAERSWRDHTARYISSYTERLSGDGHRSEGFDEPVSVLDPDGDGHADEPAALANADLVAAYTSWRTQLLAAIPARPTYGPGKSSALARLAPDRVGTVAAPDAPGFAGSRLTSGTQVVSRAIYYGGLFPGDERAGTSPQGGFGLVGNVDASALTAAGVPELAAQAYAAAWATAPPECGIRMEIIAGIGKVETGHFTFGGAKAGADGTVSPAIIGPALDGSGKGGNTTPIYDTDGGRFDGDTVYDRAVGPMQFIPSTWASYGNGEDPQNIFSATRAAVNYLCASAPKPAKMTTAAGERAAILAYNRAGWYADKVLAAAAEYSMAAGAGAADMALNPGTEIPTVTVGGIVVAAELGPQLKALLDAAAADGVKLTGYGYRSTQRQIELRQTNGCPDIYTSPASSCRVPTARPGASMHERGLAVDFQFNGQTICYPNGPGYCRGTSNRGFHWLDKNAHRFGFKGLSSEAWHWSVNGK